uniref:RING-Gid-type domain-containing protein n=1 Tax=Steinernema glaseri TaxID=37863 RepID=A0A1I8A411_9BILA
MWFSLLLFGVFSTLVSWLTAQAFVVSDPLCVKIKCGLAISRLSTLLSVFTQFQASMSEPVLKYLDSALTQLKDIKTKWPDRIDQQIKRIEMLYNELLLNTDATDEADQELSVTSQYLFENALSETKSLLDELSSEHRQVHSSISRCGKEIERNFHADLSGIIRNQKDIEEDEANSARVNKLIFDYLNSVGKVDVAECLRKEANVQPEHELNAEEVRGVMEAYRDGDFLHAINWIEVKFPKKLDLLFELHQQHVIQMLVAGKKSEALQYVRSQMASFNWQFGQRLAFLSGAIVSPSDHPRYAILRQKSLNLQVEHALARLLSGTFSHLSEILDTGIRTVPSLIRLRQIMAARQEQLFVADELPVEIPIEKHVHSTFTCPILKIQSTDNNPPMRLACGHVISRDALNKLAQNSRQIRLKCPYCPMESSASDAKRVYF